MGRSRTASGSRRRSPPPPCPSPASSSAASSVSRIIAPQVTSVRSVPSRSTKQRSSGSAAPLSATSSLSSAVEPRRLEEHHRVGIADRGEQQPVGAARRGGDDHAQARDVREQRLGALRVVLGRMDAAAHRRAQHHRAGEPAARAVAQPRRMVDELVDRRIDEAQELDLGDRPQALRGQADRQAGDQPPRRAACPAPARRRSGRAARRWRGIRRRRRPRPRRARSRSSSSAMARASARLIASTRVDLSHGSCLPRDRLPLRLQSAAAASRTGDRTSTPAAARAAPRYACGGGLDRLRHSPCSRSSSCLVQPPALGQVGAQPRDRLSLPAAALPRRRRGSGAASSAVVWSPSR